MSRRQIRDRLRVDNNDVLNRLLDGGPAPEWTSRPRAMDGLRAKARELRLRGMTYDQIQMEPGCPKGSISLWVRDPPKPERKRTTEQASEIARRGWEATLQRRDAERVRTKKAAEGEIGSLSPREIFLVGAASTGRRGPGRSLTGLRRGSLRQQRPRHDHGPSRMAAPLGRTAGTPSFPRAHPRDRRCRSCGALLGRSHRRRRLGVREDFARKTPPKTNRKNTGKGYQGCPAVRVLKSADLYRRIEGWWCGIVGAAKCVDQENRT